MYVISDIIFNDYHEIYIHINSNKKKKKKVFTHIGFKEKEKTIYIISINDLYKYIKND